MKRERNASSGQCLDEIKEEIDSKTKHKSKFHSTRTQGIMNTSISSGKFSMRKKNIYIGESDSFVESLENSSSPTDQWI